MTDIDPHLQGAIVRLVLALESMDRRYCLIGALVPRFLMLVPPPQRTRDVDVVVDVGSIQDVEQLTRDLRSRGYADVAPPMRFRDESGVLVDVIPYSDALAPEGRLSLPGGIELGAEGFAHLIHHAVRVELVPGLLPVACACWNEPYSNGPKDLPTCACVRGVAASCRELWREKGKKKAKW